MDAFTTPETAPDDGLRNAVPVPAEACTPVSEPDYLRRVYWWAYLHPRAIRVFERQWLVNLILWGNYKALRDAALAELAGAREGRVLQLACVYGDFSRKLAACLAGDGSLSVVDVAQIQLDNLHRKLGAAESVTLHRQNSAALTFGDGSFDTAVAFFLLHEQPEDVRIRTLREAIRVVRPGGKLVIVDYHRPNTRHPLRPVMPLIFRTLEPFAMDLWRTDVRTWLPSDRRCDTTKETFFGGLYQKITVVPH